MRFTNLNFTVGGIVMLFNAVQLNALVPIFCSPSLNVTSLKFLQILNVLVPISIRVDGTLRFSNDLQSKNAPFPIFCSPSFNISSFKLLQSLNAPWPESLSVVSRVTKAGNLGRKTWRSCPPLISKYLSVSKNDPDITFTVAKTQYILYVWESTQVPNDVKCKAEWYVMVHWGAYKWKFERRGGMVWKLSWDHCNNKQ